MNTYRLIIPVIVVAFALPAIQCEAQKLKLPNFLPFKKKSEEVKPFALSDQSRGQSWQARTAENNRQAQAQEHRNLFDFLKPKERSAQKSGPKANFNSRSKAFFARTGEELGQFSDGTKKFLSDAWNPPRAHSAWWNQGPKTLAPKQPLFSWPGSQNHQQSTQPPLRPQAQTARQYQNGQPRHRFR